MKILTGPQIKEADRHTIENEPIDSINLMERASETIAQWICNNIGQEIPLLFFIGKGNNGGDGLAAARMLYRAGFDCSIYLAYGKEELSAECRFNLERLPDGIVVHKFPFEPLPEDGIIIDALLGTGTDGRELPSVVKEMISVINNSGLKVISLDMPSGMRTEFENTSREMVHAHTTLTIEFPKLAQLLPESGDNCGDIVVLPIGLDEEYISSVSSGYFYVTDEIIRNLIKLRLKFAHKGTYGHALMVCGSEGMMGAAILSVGAALRSGCGLVTAHIPREERIALYASCPSAILSLDPSARFSELPKDIETYSAIGVGCGLGKSSVPESALEELFSKAKNNNLVIDADALNLISANPRLRDAIPGCSVLTPHPGELRRLVGEWKDDEHKIALTREFAARHRVILIVKGAHTMICAPDGECFLNSTGTPAMAKGGSGDILTGLITGLIARGYGPLQASLIGVYVHGLAGEKAAEYYSIEAMCSSDMLDFLPEAMKELE